MYVVSSGIYCGSAKQTRYRLDYLAKGPQLLDNIELVQYNLFSIASSNPYLLLKDKEIECLLTDSKSIRRCAMDKEMTIEEIESQFDSEWVLIEDPKTDEDLKVLGGRVLHHSKDRDEVYRKAVSLRPTRSALIYTGEIPEDTAVVL